MIPNRLGSKTFRKRFTTLALLAPLLVGLAACNPTYKCRYELTLVVDDGGKLVSGSSVREDWVRDTSNGLPSAGGLDEGTIGEATLVRLSNGRIIAVPLRGRTAVKGRPVPDFSPWRGSEYLIQGYGIASNEWKGGRNRAWDAIANIHKEPSVQLAMSEFPLLITFDHGNNPSGVTVVDPVKRAGGSERTVRVVSVSIRRTSKPIFQEQIERTLPWVDDPGRGNLEGDAQGLPERAVGPLASHLYPSDFKLQK